MTGTAETEEDEFQRDLQARRARHPDERADPHAWTTTTVIYKTQAREVQRRHRGDRAPARAEAAGARRHGHGRGLGGHLAAAQAQQDPAQRPEREAPPERGGDRDAARARPARSRSPRTWPAAEPTSSSGRASSGARSAASGARTRTARTARTTTRTDRGVPGGHPVRPPHHRHGAARGPAHRPAAPRPSGRQGDPGASQFFISLEDDLMRLFGSERIAKVMTTLGVQEGEVISTRW